MRNILFISPTGGYAGIDVSLEMLVCGLDRTRFNPIVVFPLESKLKPEFEQQGIRCYRLPLNWWFPTGYAGNDLLHVLPTLRSKIEPLVQIIFDNKIDLVLSNTTVGMDGAVAAGIAGVPHAFFAHAQFVGNIYQNMSEEIRGDLYRLMGDLSERMICCSQPLCEVMNRYMENAVCIVNGVDTDRFAFHQRTRSDFSRLDMVCVGHYNANKQQDFVLRALAVLRKKQPELLERIHFTMMGPGEAAYLAQLKEFVKKQKLQKYVAFEDFHDDIAQRLSSYNVYINSSVTENFPISVLEAMSNGLPLLAVPNDGTRQLVEEGKTGYLCDTPEEMAEKMAFLLQHPEVLEAFSAAARHRVETLFSKQIFLKRFQQEFEAILAAPRTSNRHPGLVRILYDLLTTPVRSRYPKLKVLVIYPREAQASYVIAAQHPLEEMEKEGLVEYRAVIPAELTEKDRQWADVVYCIRFYDDFIYRVLQETRQAGKPFVWYIDDNYFAIRFDGGEVRHESVENSWFERMFHDSSAVIVNSGELYHAGNYLKSNVYRLPTYQIVEEEPKAHSPSSKPFVRFGFMGTLKRDQDFEFVVPALERVQQEYGERVQIDFIGYAPEQLKSRPGVSTFDFMYDYDGFRRFFKSREWDFALAPLSDTVFNRSKTNNKYREYSSFAIPGIYSDMAAYNTCVQDGENGLLVANQPEDWYQAMRRMIEAPDLREKLGKAAFQDIQEHYSIRRFSDGLIDVLQSARAAAACGADNPQAVLSAVPESVFSPQESGFSFLGRDDILCFSKNILQSRSYKIRCRTDRFNQLGFLFASEESRCEGTVTLELFSESGRLLASSQIQLRQIVYHQWTYFTFGEITGEKGSPLLVRLSFAYEPGSGHMGVYEDRRRRTFWYRVFRFLGHPLLGNDVLVVDYQLKDREKKDQENEISV